jgi:hypothetical protein
MAKKKVWRGRRVYERWLDRGEREGWSVAELARRSRIPESTLQRWQRRLRDAGRETGFVEVVPAVTGAAGSRAEIVLRNGRRLLVPIGSPSDGVRSLVTLLESC